MLYPQNPVLIMDTFMNRAIPPGGRLGKESFSVHLLIQGSCQKEQRSPLPTIKEVAA